MRSFFIALFSPLVLGACSHIDPLDSVLVPDDGETIVTGKVISIDDAVPADGGVTLVIRSAAGREYTAYLSSFFTLPPPPQSDWALYEIIRDLQPGDSVVVKGPVTEFGIRITGIKRH